MHTMKQRSWLLAAVLVSVSTPALLHADAAIFSNVGVAIPEGSGAVEGSSYGGLNEYLAVGFAFTPTTTAMFTAALADVWTLTINDASVSASIYSDAGGVPGSLLIQLDTASAPQFNSLPQLPFSSNHVSFTQISGPPVTLAAGTQYWLVIAPGDGDAYVRYAYGNGATSDVPFAQQSSGQNFAWMSFATANVEFEIDGGTVIAPPPSCTSISSPGQLTFGEGGGSANVNFNNAPCTWSVLGNPAWITLTDASDSGSSFAFTVAANPPPGSTRQAELIINGGGNSLTVNIRQSGLVCTYTLTDSAGFSQTSFPASGGAGATINVVAPPGCPWTAMATPGQSLISFSTYPSGIGNGSIGYSVAPNASSSPQSGAITIANESYLINEQAAGSQPNSCSFDAITPAPIRPEGYSEKVADTVFTCSGQAPPGGVTGDILISFNAGITNLLLSSGSTDALLLQNEPTGATLALGANAFRGVLSTLNGAGAILFPSVQLASVSGGAFSHTWRIANARVSAQGLEGSTVLATISIAATAPFTIGYQPAGCRFCLQPQHVLGFRLKGRVGPKYPAGELHRRLRHGV